MSNTTPHAFVVKECHKSSTFVKTMNKDAMWSDIRICGEGTGVI